MKNFKSYFKIPTEPSDVYAALTNPLTIQLWTGDEAVMSTEPGSEFSMWEGSITGKNLEFEPNKKIVQQWYFGDQVSTGTLINTNSELIHVYPNPTASNLNIEINKAIDHKGLNMKIMNVYGQTIFTDIITNSNYEIGDLAHGLYYIEIFDKSNNLFYKQKFIVQK